MVSAHDRHAGHGIVFILMSAALARTLRSHARGTRFLAILVTLYVVMAAVSLLYVSAWIPVLTGFRSAVPTCRCLGFGWLQGIARAFGGIFTEQPLLQVLVAARLPVRSWDPSAPSIRPRTVSSLPATGFSRHSRSSSGTTPS